MELLKLSQFKLQLQTLITHVRQLRDREQSFTEQHNLQIQKQKQTEEEFGRKLQELNSELTSSNETRQKLERKVCYLQNENALLESKHTDLKSAMDSLLLSRGNFENVYQDSTSEMKRTIEIRDKKISLLSEKLNSHLLLFESIGKEAFSVKEVVDNMQRLVSDKEYIVAELKSKMDSVFKLEKDFVEKTTDLETKLQKYEDEFQRKDKIISELEAEVEASKFGSNEQPQIEETHSHLHRTLSAKELIIENLISEKKALYFEVESLGFILQKIKDTVALMKEKDKEVFTSILENQEGNAMGSTENNYRFEDAVQHDIQISPSKVYDRGTVEITDSPRYHDQNSVSNQVQDNHGISSCAADSTCVDPQLATNTLSISINEAKDDCTELVHQLDFECSTTQTKPFEHPG